MNSKYFKTVEVIVVGDDKYHCCLFQVWSMINLNSCACN